MGPARSVTNDPELVDGWVAGGPRPITIEVEPFATMRSPIMASPRAEPPANLDNGEAVVLPPLRGFMAPSALALVVAAPLALLVGWQVALGAGLLATVIREVRRRIPESYSLAAGFLPYRPDDAWPHGVREDDDVRWNWSASQAAPSREGR